MVHLAWAKFDALATRRRTRGVARLLLLLSSAVVTGGCAATLMPAPNLLLAQSPGPFVAVPTPLQTPQAEVLYVTDRARDDVGGGPPRYGSNRSASLAFGAAHVCWGEIATWHQLCDQSCRKSRSAHLGTHVESIAELGRLPETPWKAETMPDGAIVVAAGVREEYDRQVAAFQKLIAERLAYSPRKDAFVYVHGFNDGFDDALPVIAELWHFIGRIGVPIAYTWPAGKGFNVRGYNYDRESGEFTIFHLKQFLEALAAAPGLERVHLIAHSRGADVLCSALRELNIKYRAKYPDEEAPTARALRIHHVVLAAPDMDLAVARQRIEAERLRRACRRLTIYTSPDDLAISFVKWLFDSTIRVGTLGFASLPVHEQTALAQLPDVELINARVTKDLVGHSYFYSNPAVSSDLILLLRDDRRAGPEHGRPLRHVHGSFWELSDGYPNGEARESPQSPNGFPGTQPAASTQPK
jgi:esterase/lipase superfamily enzyme